MNEEITEEDFITMKNSYGKLTDPNEDRVGHLERLFLLHTEYTGKHWSVSSRTCGSCVNQVKKGIEQLIKKYDGE
mgnify:FL=1